MARTVSIRRSLLTNLLALVALLGGAVLGTTFLGASRAVRALSGELITRSLERSEAELRRFFEPVERSLAMARAWGEAGLLGGEDPQALDRLLAPVVRSHPQIAAVLVADDRGREHLVMRADGGLRSRETRAEEWGPQVRWLAWSDAEPTPVASTEAVDYDPRTRPWYRGALAQQGVHWTEPYTFFASKRPGMTASSAFDAGDGRTRVLGIDVLLSEISAFTTSFAVSPSGLAFVLTGDGRLIGLPARLFPDAEAERAALLKRPLDAGIPLLADIAELRRTLPEDHSGPVRFLSGGEAWWGEVRPFRLAPGRDLLVAVLVPEADLLGGVAQLRLAILGLTAAALGLAVLLAVRMARRYSRPIEVLVHESDRIAVGDLEPGEPLRSSVQEIRRLAGAHDHMRTALRSLLRLERDLQVARQIQQDTFPAAMPKLEGYDVDAWSQPADETGGDTYDVVSGDHRVLLLLADATGHGIGPALSATQVRAMLRMAVRLEAGLLSIARHMNEQLHADLQRGRFVTAWLGELDLRAHVLRSLAAGQAPLLRYEAARDRFEELPADTAPLGVLPELDAAGAREIALAPGDLVAVLSDGIFDARSPAGEAFGVERATRAMRAHRHESASRILAALRDVLDSFCAGRPAADDRTALLVKRHP